MSEVKRWWSRNYDFHHKTPHCEGQCTEVVAASDYDRDVAAPVEREERRKEFRRGNERVYDSSGYPEWDRRKSDRRRAGSGE